MRQVHSYNSDTGRYVATFKSSSEAARHLGIDYQAILTSIKHRKSTVGYFWSYQLLDVIKIPTALEIAQSLFGKDGRLSSSSISNLGKSEIEILKRSNPALVSQNIAEHVYWVINTLTDYHKKCKTCQKITPFLDSTKGYQDFCSLSCVQNSLEIIQKKKDTVYKRYGVSSIWDVQDIREKRQKTITERYGSYTNLLERAKNIGCKKYGVDHVSHIPGLQDTRITTVKLLAAENLKTTLKALCFDINQYNGHESILDFTCNQCNFSFSTYPSINVACPRCTRKGFRTLLEKEFAENINLNLPVRCNKKIACDDKTFFIPDFYWPDKKLIVELDGNWWHSELNAEKHGADKLKSYHKQQAYSKLGIDSLFFFEDEINYRTDILISIVKSKLGIYDKRCYARDCKIEEISNESANIFFEENHLQGAGRQKFSLGIFFDSELIGAASFGKPRYSSKADLELIRLCFKRGYQIAGGAGKLLKSVRDKSIISYSNNRISTGKVYRALGFTLIAERPPTYWYMYRKDYLTRYHRSNFQKKNLIICDEDKKSTEWELAKRAKLDRIWDCGSKTWLLTP